MELVTKNNLSKDRIVRLTPSGKDWLRHAGSTYFGVDLYIKEYRLNDSDGEFVSIQTKEERKRGTANKRVRVGQYSSAVEMKYDLYYVNPIYSIDDITDNLDKLASKL